jgi:hypothetical protein
MLAFQAGDESAFARLIENNQARVYGVVHRFCAGRGDVEDLVQEVFLRVFRSADGSKTFEGEIRSYDAEAGKVTVLLKNGRALTFDQAKLSEDDISFCKEWHAEANKPDPTEALEAQILGAKIAKAKLHRLVGKKFAKAELEFAPEYYILYFSGSW